MDQKKQISDKPEPAAAEQTPQPELQLGRDDLVIFGEDGKFYVVSPDTYTSEPLPRRLMSTSEFVVGLGSMVSDISALQSVTRADQPSELRELTQDMAGIMLNLAAIRLVSEKAGDPPISLIEDPGCQCQDTPVAQPEQAHPPGSPQRQEEELRLEKDDLVIFGTDRTFYLLKKKIYEKMELPRVLESTPTIMVQLGAQLADMPSLPTAGSACFLLNLASIRHGSAKAAMLIEKNSLESQLGEEQYTAARLDAEIAGTPVPRMDSFVPTRSVAEKDESPQQMVDRLATELCELKARNKQKLKELSRLKREKKVNHKQSPEALADWERKLTAWAAKLADKERELTGKEWGPTEGAEPGDAGASH